MSGALPRAGKDLPRVRAVRDEIRERVTDLAEAG